MKKEDISMKDPMIQPCKAWAEKLAATHPDDLTPSEWTKLKDHITRCPACAAVRAEYLLMDERISNYPVNESLLCPPSFSPIPRQFADSDIGPALLMVDRVYRSSLHGWLSWFVPFRSAILYMRRVSIVFLIVIICLAVSLLLGIYFLKTSVPGL